MQSLSLNSLTQETSHDCVDFKARSLFTTGDFEFQFRFDPSKHLDDNIRFLHVPCETACHLQFGQFPSQMALPLKILTWPVKSVRCAFHIEVRFLGIMSGRIISIFQQGVSLSLYRCKPIEVLVAVLVVVVAAMEDSMIWSKKVMPLLVLWSSWIRLIYPSPPQISPAQLHNVL